MVGDEILIEIDETLNRLIENAEVIQKVDPKALSDQEIDSFQKTQESLLHHLIHMDELLERKRKVGPIDKRASRFQIQEKRVRFEQLKNLYTPTLSKPKQIIVPKRRRKKFLVLI